MKKLKSDSIFGKYLTGSFLSLKAALYLFFFEILLATLFYVLYEGYTIIEAIYMSVIIVSTIGFGEVNSLSSGGQLFTIFFILINIGIFAYTLSAFSYFVIQGELFKKMHLDRIKKKIDALNNHVIICGYGRYGKEIASNFIGLNIEFVIIENDKEKIQHLKSDQNLLIIEGDSTDDDILYSAGIMRAKALISALQDDTENLYTMLTVRELNPSINLISRAQNKRAQHKLLLAGASHVIMPEQIGGYYMATLVNKPDVGEFFNFISREYDSDMGYETIHYEDLPNDRLGKTIAELNLRKETGVNIIGFRLGDHKYIVNPDPSTILVNDSSFIVLGNKMQLEKLKIYMNT